jgi:hypothetical protein
MSVKRRIAKGGDHHSWARRDYESVDCYATGCLFNKNETCSVPSRCKIGPDGKCQEFVATPTPPKPDGD